MENNALNTLKMMDRETVPGLWTTNGRSLFPGDGVPFGFAKVNPLEFLCHLRNLAPELLTLWDTAEQGGDLKEALDALNKKATHLLDEAKNAKK